jgi:EAL domain-containing protein (putative c-di-GMP-specific phosphodiesterase class I)/GGDEF domain-containing protein
MSERNMTSESVHEVEIAYSQNALLDKTHDYGLSKSTLCSKVRINQKKLADLEVDEYHQAESYVSKLFHEIRNWQPSQNFEIFTSQINQLVYLWLNAIQDGTSSHIILKFLKAFELKSSFGRSNSSKLHLFLFELVIESTRRHEKIAHEYAANYDSNTMLPNAIQLTKAIDFAFSKGSEDSLIGLFSMHFQATKNKLSLSKIETLDLNKQIASLLMQNITADSLLYFSGDSQFDLLIPNLSSISQLNLLAAKISRVFEQMLFLKFQSILATPFIGCAYTYTKAHSTRELYNDAKLALDSAILRLQPFVIYSEELEEQLLEQNSIEAKVLEAFASDNLTLFFQPIVNLKNNKCVGAELLLRWSEKFGSNIYPSLTIEILNKVGKGKLFTRWLINSACRFASELIHEHNLKIYLTLNLRAEDLYDIELPHLLIQAISLWKLDTKDIILEITENGILEYNESSTSVINQLAENGFKFALDDFGTGFSSLSRLRAMPIDIIKIDQSFVRNIDESRDDFEIVQSIALLAKSLGKEVLAEGVETKSCLDLIKKLEIDKCQGYFYSKPIPFEQFIDWVKSH